MGGGGTRTSWEMMGWTEADNKNPHAQRFIFPLIFCSFFLTQLSHLGLKPYSVNSVLPSLYLIPQPLALPLGHHPHITASSHLPPSPSSSRPHCPGLAEMSVSPTPTHPRSSPPPPPPCPESPVPCPPGPAHTPPADRPARSGPARSLRPPEP